MEYSKATQRNATQREDPRLELGVQGGLQLWEQQHLEPPLKFSGIKLEECLVRIANELQHHSCVVLRPDMTQERLGDKHSLSMACRGFPDGNPPVLREEHDSVEDLVATVRDVRAEDRSGL